MTLVSAIGLLSASGVAPYRGRGAYRRPFRRTRKRGPDVGRGRTPEHYLLHAHEYEQLYLRSDLESGGDIARLLDHETQGFDAHDAYRNTELGEFTFPIRVFERGSLTRVIADGRGVFVTTDQLDMTSFEELAAAVRQVPEPER